MKILLVEDDANLRDTYRMLLTQMNGFKLAEADSIESAREVYKIFKPDVVFLDILLKDGNAGFLIPEFKASKVYVISAWPDAKNLAEQFGADHFLEKPFNIGSIEDLVKRKNSLTI